MTRTALRDLSNTPQRGLAIRHERGLDGGGGVLQPSFQKQAAWAVASVGAVKINFSDMPCGNTYAYGSTSPKHRDPLSLLAPVAHTMRSPAAHELKLQQQQQNVSLVRDFRRVSAVAASLSPPSPAETNATQSALESCIATLDNLMPNLSATLGDASLVDQSATASPQSRTALTYSASCVEGASTNTRPERMDVGQRSLATEESLAQAHASSPFPIQLNLSNAVVSPALRSPATIVPARKSEGFHTSRRSNLEITLTPTHGAQYDTDKAVATLGDAMLRLQKELNMLGHELRTPAPSTTASLLPSPSAQRDSSVDGASASLVVWPGSGCKTPRESAAMEDDTREQDSWRILSPGDCVLEVCQRETSVGRVAARCIALQLPRVFG